MRTIALAGFGKPSLGPVYGLPEDVEIWALNDAPQRFDYRIDVLFEMHDYEKLYDPNNYQQNHRAHLDFLQNTAKPVYMQEAFSEFPSSIAYPLDAALGLVDGCGRFAFSFCYMAALAILQKVDRVEIYGFEMDIFDTEHRWQKPMGLYWIGRMEGAGIDVYIPPESSLFPEYKLYGYERFHMVGRHAIEGNLKRYKKQFKANQDQMERWSEIMEKRMLSGKGDVGEASTKFIDYKTRCAVADGAVQALQQLLDECDLSEDWKPKTMEMQK